MKMSHGLLSITLLLSAVQLVADCDTKCIKAEYEEVRGCCGGRTEGSDEQDACDEGCVQDEDGNCVCDEKCGCNKPNRTRAEGEEQRMCEDCGEELTERSSCGCSSCSCKPCGCK